MIRPLIPKSLFYHWGTIEAQMLSKRLLICLDFDGTLAALASTPAKAKLEKSMKKVLMKISENKQYRLAILSGRSLTDIKVKVGIEGIIYSGNHGYEIQGLGFDYQKSVPDSIRQAFVDVKLTLKSKLDEIPGTILEDKGISLGIHYRRVKLWDIYKLKRIVAKAIHDYCIRGQIILRRGKKVLEVMPKINWDKGSALEWIMKKERISKASQRIVPVYIGDDKTDEDAFKKINIMGGLSVLVGKPKLTHAKYYVSDTEEVEKLLQRLDRMLGREAK